MTRISRSIRKYSFFYSTILLGSLGLLFAYLKKPGISDLCFIISSLTALVVGTLRLLDTLKHGYYGLPLLQLIAITAALLLKNPETAALLALMLSIEQTAFTWYQRKISKKMALLHIKHSPFLRFLDVVNLPFTVLVILIGGAVWTVSGETTRFLEVVASASSAPLLLFAPIGLVSGMNKLRNLGINLRSAIVFEKLADVKSVVLRKSGVLTEHDVAVSSVKPFGKHTKQEVLKVASALASQSEHRLAQAIVAYAGTAQKVDRAKHATEIQSQGIVGRMKGLDLIIGRSSLIAAHNVSAPSDQVKNDGPVVYVAQNGELLGVISFKEEMLVGAKNLNQKLRKSGISRIALASGSNTSAVAAVAKLAGITQYYGDVDADDIISLLDDSKDTPVAFVGDEERDEAIATAADISLSVVPGENGSYLAFEDYSPTKLVSAFTIAKRTMRNTQRTVFVTLLLSLLIVLFAATGKLSPVQSAGLNVSLLVFYLGIRSVTGLRAERTQQ